MRHRVVLAAVGGACAVVAASTSISPRPPEPLVADHRVVEMNGQTVTYSQVHNAENPHSVAVTAVTIGDAASGERMTLTFDRPVSSRAAEDEARGWTTTRPPSVAEQMRGYDAARRAGNGEPLPEHDILGLTPPS